MTIASNGVIALYAGSGSTGPFALTDFRNSEPILFNEDGDILVRYYDPDDPTNETHDLTLTTDYAISGAGGSVAGSVTLTNALTSGFTLLMVRREDQTQELDMQYGGDLSLDQLEASLDKLTRLVQEHEEILGRTFKIEAGIATFRTVNVPQPVADTYWHWNDDLEVEFSAVNLLRAGTDVPSDSLGIDGDFFIDTVHSKLYGPKTGGAWGVGLSIVGPTGATGATGATGPSGQTVLNGTGAPSNGLGNDGDFYIDTSFNIYGPKAGGVWPAGTSLIGPSGPGTGDFNGPASSTDNAIVRFDGTGGKTGQNSSVTISDAGTVSGLLFTSSGLLIGDTDSSHHVNLKFNSNITADRIFNIVPGDADRTISLAGDLTVSANSAISGTAYVVGGTQVAIGDGGTGQITASAAFNALKQAATTTQSGVFEIATDAEVRSSAVGTVAITPANIEGASAFVSLSGSTTISFDWDAGINFFVNISGTCTLANPTNAQPGTFRTIFVIGDGTTSRQLGFGTNYLGNVSAVTGVTSGSRYLISMQATDNTFVFVHPKSVAF